MKCTLIGVCAFFKLYTVIDNFCHLLITFANSLDPDQSRQNVAPDLDPNIIYGYSSLDTTHFVEPDLGPTAFKDKKK